MGVACERSTKLWSSSVVCEASWSAKVSNVIRFLRLDVDSALLIGPVFVRWC